MKKKSIRDKLLKNFALFSLIPVILFCVVMLFYILVNVQEKRKDEICSTLGNQADQIDKILQQAYQIGQTVADDEAVNQILANKFQTEQEQHASEIKLNSLLLGTSGYFDGSVKVYIIGENGGLYKNSPYSLKEKEYTQEDWYTLVKEQKESHWFELHSESYFAETAEAEFISLGIPVSEARTGRILGCVMVEIGVSDILRNSHYVEDGGELYLFYPDTKFRIVDEKVELYDNDRLTLIQKDGLAEQEEVEQLRPEVLKTTKLLTYWKKDFPQKSFGAVSGYMTAYQQMDVNDWILVYFLPQVNYYRLLIVVVTVSLFVTALLIVGSVYVSYKVAGSITRPILSLKENVERVQEGDFETTVTCEAEDEIGELGAQFNEMVVEIRNLMDRIRTEHERQRHYELLLLQAQINPHFLYNTLDSLMWLIRMKNQEDAENMLDALTCFFKTGLNKGSERVAIKNEISNVESYLTIQLMRYKKKLSFSISVDEEVESYIVPKLILQPLVENSIYHGIKGKDKGGSIEIKGTKKNGRVILCVEDTGLGMPPKQLGKIQRMLSEGIVEESDSYGLTNVNERLKLFFGEGCIMKVDSTDGVGTKVSIEIREECMHV